MIGQALVELTANELVSSPDIDRFLEMQVSGVFAAPAPVRPLPKRRTTIAFVGPAGAGKTTTLLKLATHPKLYGKQQVGIISMDTRRLAAIEQIRTFARISGIPLEVVYNIEQMQVAQQRLQGMSIVLVDTSGCNPRDEKGLDTLHTFMDQADCQEVHLVLSATTRDRELHFICDKFRTVPYTHLLFTHADEAMQYGTMANIARYAAKPIRFIGSGTSIPEDIQTVEPHEIAEKILHPEQVETYLENRLG